MRERDNVVIYAYKPFCFSKAERFLLFECGGHSNNKSNDNSGLHALKNKNCGVDPNKKVNIMILLENVKKIYKAKSGDVTAVDNANLKIEKGEIFGVIGYSGAGKVR